MKHRRRRITRPPVSPTTFAGSEPPGRNQTRHGHRIAQMDRVCDEVVERVPSRWTSRRYGPGSDCAGRSREKLVLIAASIAADASTTRAGSAVVRNRVLA
jgi:hypothetical protein